MESFVRRENIKRYRKLLREVEDEGARRRILKLLAKAERDEDGAEQAAGEFQGAMGKQRSPAPLLRVKRANPPEEFESLIGTDRAAGGSV